MPDRKKEKPLYKKINIPYSKEAARCILSLINYGNNDALLNILKYYDNSFIKDNKVSLKYAFMSFLLSDSGNDNKINSNANFLRFLYIFSMGLKRLKIWQKSDKELGKFLGEVFAHFFSLKNKNNLHFHLGSNAIVFENLNKRIIYENQIFNNFVFECKNYKNHLYGKYLPMGEIDFTSEIVVNGKTKKINSIEKLKNIKTAEEYLKINQVLIEKLYNLQNIPCPLCNPSAIKKGDSPKTCKDCNEAIFILAEIKYLTDATNKDGQIMRGLSNFKRNDKYKKMRQRIYENIKNSFKSNSFTKCYKKHIEPLISYCKGISADDNKFRDKEIKISKLENTVKIWKEVNFTSET